jgi:hypothetical protein
MDTDIKLKAVLYAIPLFLTPFADKIISILFQDKWPSLQMVLGCALLGIIASSLGLRMYFDGSYERSKGLDNSGPNGPGPNGASSNGNGTPPVVVPPAVVSPAVPPVVPPKV